MVITRINVWKRTTWDLTREAAAADRMCQFEEKYRKTPETRVVDMRKIEFFFLWQYVGSLTHVLIYHIGIFKTLRHGDSCYYGLGKLLSSKDMFKNV